MTIEVETEVVDDRRAALEAAITAAEEAPAPAPAPAPEPAPDDDSGKAGIAPGSPEGEGAATLVAPTPSDAPTGLESDTGNLAVDKAPQSWRGPQKEKWGRGTRILPVLKHTVEVVGRDSDLTLGVIITDGIIEDAEVQQAFSVYDRGIEIVGMGRKILLEIGRASCRERVSY